MMVGKSMAAKFKTVRDCFRFIDEDHSGTVNLEEVERLLRQFNFDHEFAIEFFGLIDKDGSGEISFNELQAFIGPYIQPGYQAPLQTMSAEPQSFGEIHEKNHDTFKNMHRTTYGDMVRGCESIDNGRTPGMPGYKGHIPTPLSQASSEDRDEIPSFKALKEGLNSKISSRRESETVVSSTCRPPNSKSPLAPYTDGSVLRRLNEAALRAGSVVGGDVYRRMDRSLSK